MSKTYNDNVQALDYFFTDTKFIIIQNSIKLAKKFWPLLFELGTFAHTYFFSSCPEFTQSTLMAKDVCSTFSVTVCLKK